MSPKKTVFLHIPKTAGTTLTYIIDRNYQESEIQKLYNPDSFDKDLHDGLKSDETKMLYGHFAYNQILRQSDCYVFTFLRDPISRTVSNFIHLKNSQEPQHKKWMKDVRYFPDFLKQKQSFNWQARHLSGQKFHADFGKDLGKSLEMAKENMLSMNFVGLTEKFDDSLMCLSSELKWKRLRFEKQNVQFSNDEALELAEKYIDEICEQNLLDLELYEMARTLFKDKNRSFTESDRLIYSIKKWI